MKKLITLTTLLFLGTSWAQQSLKVMNWNIFMIPPIVYKSCQCDRAQLIGDQVADWNPDVIVFNEAFQKKPRKIIWKALKEQYPYASKQTKGGLFKVNSGVWILSKYEIKKQRNIIFKAKEGSDGMSKKGAVMAELNVNGQHIQVFGTHVQSGGENVAVREKQFKQMMDELIKPNYCDTIPQFVSGDLNTNYFKTPDLSAMLSIFDAETPSFEGEQYSIDGERNDLNWKFFGSEEQILDYVLVLKNKKHRIRTGITRILSAVQSRKICKEEFTALSDHNPVMTEIIIE
ncbi:MAG: sphingomyelin phosphodiesterase [Bacteroidota bacterium]